ncbi:response regulator receiver domain-containing protein [Rhizobium sp. PP-F2F-G36]|nr:response regulator receiver domain-containing protein [Rhizobium sp. PP-F2F-G36]
MLISRTSNHICGLVDLKPLYDGILVLRLETLLSIKRVLVLEDNFIIAMEAEDILRTLGVETVDIATNVAQAKQLVDEHAFDFALLDVNLGSETSFDFANILVSRDTPFGFVSGYGESAMFPGSHRDRPRITKPFNETSMSQLLASVSGAADAVEAPAEASSKALR